MRRWVTFTVLVLAIFHLGCLSGGVDLESSQNGARYLSVQTATYCETGQLCGRACIADDVACESAMMAEVANPSALAGEPGGFICMTGKPCGRACISIEKACTPGLNRPVRAPAGQSPSGGPKCTTGKPCGRSCISWDKKCHK